MNKKGLFIICTLLMLSVNVNRADAGIVLGVPDSVAKVGNFIQSFMESFEKVSQQVNQIKKGGIKGFAKSGLMGSLTKGPLAGAFGSFKFPSWGALKGNQQDQALFASIQAQSRKEQEAQQLNEEQQANENARKEVLDNKIAETQKNRESVENEYTAWLESDEGAVACSKYEEIKLKYENATSEEQEKMLNEYVLRQRNCDVFKVKDAEYKKTKENLDKDLQKLKKEKEKVGTEDDAEHMHYEKMKEELEKTAKDPARPGQAEGSTESLLSGVINENSTWDTVDLDKLQPKSEQYSNFIAKYFYDPQDIGTVTIGDQTLDVLATEAHDKREKYKGAGDEVDRQRGYLITDKAANLLRVSAVMRGKLPELRKAIDEASKTAAKAENQSAAISSYTLIRLINAKILVMYAQLLSARIQYDAARDLRKVDKEKARVGSAGYVPTMNMNKYILTQEEVKALIIPREEK